MAMGGALAFFKFARIGATKTDMSNLPTYVGEIVAANTTAAEAFIQVFWLAAASVTLGTTVADAVIPVPGSGGVVISFMDQGWKTMGTAWCMAGTTTATGSTEALIDVSVWRKL